LREALAAEAAGDSVLSGIVSSSRVEGPSAVHDLTARLAQDAAERLYLPTTTTTFLPIGSSFIFYPQPS
jgi:hypothetical protein